MNTPQQTIRTKIEEKERGMVIITGKTIYTHNPVFKHSVKEKGKIHTAKKAHDAKWFKIFGTKRPTAGVVAKHFLNQKP